MGTYAGFVFRQPSHHLHERGLHTFYDLQHELGKGSFATVMKALHRTEGKWYAVKMIQANKLRRDFSSVTVRGLQADSKTSSFAREINILEKLQHRNICQLKEVFYEEYNISECAFALPMEPSLKRNIDLVLEWVTGGDLLDYILRRNGIRKCYIFPTLRAVLSILQRSLKPNILRTKCATPSL